ncbi:MAG: serine/threonine-protein kinase, partial [Kofleriaceae bacterium]
SLGSCLYEMLTRIPPFTATNEMDLLIKVRDAKYRAVSELQPGIPPELEAITDKCLTRSRANRYQTAAEVEGDLRAFLRKFMPNYSRSHLGRFIRKMFATEIERELRMLEEFVMTDDVSDDVGESLMHRDEDFEPPEVPFQPKPTSVSVAALRDSNDFSGDSNFTTMPKVEPPPRTDQSVAVKPPPPQQPSVHDANTKILNDRGRSVQQHQPPPPPPKRGRTQPPPPPPAAKKGKPSTVRPIFDEDLHAAPTMIIDIGRMRQRRRG